MREWLTAIIVLLIVAVILDGLRRMRLHRRSSLRMSLSLNQGTNNKEDPAAYGSELPSGGARVVDVREDNDAKQLNQQIRKNSKEKISRLGRPYKIPEQVTLNLDEQVPMLMESVQDEKPAKKTTVASVAKARPIRKKNHQIDLIDDVGEDGRIEPQFQEVEMDEKDFDGELTPSHASVEHEQETSNEVMGNSIETAQRAEKIVKKPQVPEYEDELDDVLFAEKVSGKQYIAEPNQNSEELDEGLEFSAENKTERVEPNHSGDAAVVERVEEKAVEKVAEKVEAAPDEVEEEYIEPDLVMVINVTAAKGEYFPGRDLLDTVLAQGMRFGAMNVFHHHIEANGEGSILYSMANIVVPGTFDLNAINTFVTPGISLFLALPVEGDSGKAFETMLGTARAIAQNLGGELKDENRSVLTKQTVTHYRTRIKEYERKRLSRGRS